MTVFVDSSGLINLSPSMCYGGMEEYRAKVDGKDPPPHNYRPRIGNIAPRTDGWTPVKGNTQTPPLTGPNKNQKPAVHQPRAPLYDEVRKSAMDFNHFPKHYRH